MIMMYRLTAAALAGSLATAAFAPLAHAQTGAAVAPTGPAIPGLCFLSKEGLVGNSTVGKFVESRLQQLGQQAEAELDAEGTSLQNDAKALDAARSTLSAEQVDQRAAALQVRQRELERQVQVRRQEMSATEQKALNRVLTEASPIIQQIFRQRNCTVLLDASAAMIATPSMDLTPAVVDGLNAKITQFTFDREHIDQTAAAPSAGVQ